MDLDGDVFLFLPKCFLTFFEEPIKANGLFSISSAPKFFTKLLSDLDLSLSWFLLKSRNYPIPIPKSLSIYFGLDFSGIYIFWVE